MKRIIFSAAIVISSLGLVATNTTSSVAASTPRLGSVNATHTELDQKIVTLVPPTSNSDGRWVITLQDPTIATVNGLTLTLLKAGSTQITYTQLATATYSSNSRMAVLVVAPGTPVLGTWSAKTVTLSSATLAITAPTSSSAGTWSYALSSNTVAGHQIATLSGSTLTLNDAGTITLTGTQAATSSWKQATATTTVTITAPKPVVGTFTNVVIAKDSVASFILLAPASNSTGVWSYSSSDPSVATISGSTVTPVNVGTTTITAYQSPSAGLSSATTSMLLTITSAASVVTPTPSATPSATPSSATTPTTTPKPVVTPTPTPTPTATPTPTPKPMATPTPTPVATPTAKATPSKKPAVVPVVTVKSAGNKITITAVGGKVLATINGVAAKLGVNTVRAGDNLVIIEFDNKVIYSRVITIK